MNTKQLMIFKYFVEEQNEIAVAEILGITQPTVTFHLKNLNELYGVKLYSKKGKHFNLTEAGKSLYFNANKILHLMQETEDTMKDFEKSNRGTLKIGASHSPIYSALPNTLKKYINEYPDIDISLTVDTAPIIIKKVKAGEVEVGVIAEKGLQTSDVKIKRLFKNPLMLVMDRQHPLAQEDNLELKEILKYPFVIHHSGSTRESIDEWRKDHLIDLNVRMESNSMSSIISTISDSKMLSLLSATAIEHYSNLIAKPLPNQPSDRHISIIYRDDRFISPMIQNFINQFYLEGKNM
ncbi:MULTISPECIES: LysR family transcriptional regulator [Staphylococcus]|uniref:LysR family transcriptional regulator n=1 Tax=Staphylococcus hsinchuensis TaxID=3051183 RepID=A0ABZ3EE34_9STAP|nr:LysR family transcriptional regulator [Staphylococcus sp. Marseille-Q6910]